MREAMNTLFINKINLELYKFLQDYFKLAI